MFGGELGLKGFVGCAVAAVVLSACGSSDGADPLTRDERAAEFADIAEVLGARFNTAYLEDGAIPNTGTGRFEGYAGMVIGADADLVLLGDAEITINWLTEDIDGTIDKVFGDDGSTVEDYTGSVTLSNGDFLGNQPNAFTFDYAGSLDGQGNEITLDGSGSGILKGTPIRGLLAASDSGETEIVNGVAEDFLMSIAAINLD